MAILVVAALAACSKREPAALILATTTSTHDSGLLDYLLPRFEAAHRFKVKVIAVGTGEALAMGRRGDADVLLVHSRAAEDAFMREGCGASRRDVMHNDFLLVGPPADPAGARGLGAAAALGRVRSAGALFISRGDQSGTHRKEVELWQLAGGVPPGGARYLATGQGMGETLRVASEKNAYTLVDRASWLAARKTLELRVISEGDRRLFNPYGVIVVNQARFPRVNSVAGNALASWLVSPEAQRLIGSFGVARFGQRLFVPDALDPRR